MPSLGQIIGGSVTLALLAWTLLQIYFFRARVVKLEAEVEDIKARCHDRHGKIHSDLADAFAAIRSMDAKNQEAHTGILSKLAEMKGRQG